MSKRKQDESMHDDGSYVVKKSRKGNIIAFVLCVLIAFIIWLYATNMENKEKETHTNTNVTTSAGIAMSLPDTML